MSTPNDRDAGRLVEVPCPVCGSDRSRHVGDTRDYAFRVTDATFGVRRCADCGCGYLSPRPGEADIARYYPQDFYWSHEGTGAEIDWDRIIAVRRAQLEGKARWLEGVKPGRLLDIGAQKGEFLWAMRENGWQVEGVEMDESVPNPARMPIRYGDFLSMPFDQPGYDCITMWAVLEHVYQPDRFVARVAELLRPGGRFIGVVTNFNSIQGRFFLQDDYPRHLTLFTKGSLTHLCRRHGLRLTRLRTDDQDIFGGALNGGLVYGFKRLFGYTADEALSEWKQIRGGDTFCCCWRGRPSMLMRNLSRVDRLLTWPLEKLLDRFGFGFTLTFAAKKKP